MQRIDRRRIRKTLGSRVSRRLGTKRNTSTVRETNVRPKTRMKNIVSGINHGTIEHP